jgi:2-phosphosulfolactate phosphatase
VSGTVIIDCFPESAERYRLRHAIVAIDVIRATTTATTAIHAGRRVFPARTTDEAFVVASALREPLLVGELGGHMPVGFDMTNSPAEIAGRSEDLHRPMVLVSSSGTQLILTAAGGEGIYVACLRNYSAVARQIAGRHAHVALIGAGTRGQFRREDQIGCALVAKQLLDLGYTAENRETLDYVRRWTAGSFDAAVDAIRAGKSAEYLRKSGQERDLEFVIDHIDDLAITPWLLGRELVDAGIWQSPELSLAYHQQHRGASVE